MLQRVSRQPIPNTRVTQKRVEGFGRPADEAGGADHDSEGGDRNPLRDGDGDEGCEEEVQGPQTYQR